MLVVPADLGNLLVANYISLTKLQNFFDRYFETGTKNNGGHSIETVSLGKEVERSLSLKEFLFGDV